MCKKRFLIFVAILSTAAIGAAVYFAASYSPPAHTPAVVQIDRMPPSLLAKADTYPGEYEVFVETQIELMRCPIVLERVVARQEIKELPPLQGLSQSERIAWIAKRVTMVQRGDSELFEISLSHSDPAADASIVNAILDAYFNYIRESQASEIATVIDLLEHEMAVQKERCAKLRDDLRALEEDLSEGGRDVRDELEIAFARDGYERSRDFVDRIGARKEQLRMEIRQPQRVRLRQPASTPKSVKTKDIAQISDDSN